MRHAIVCALSWWSAASLAEPPSHYQRARVVAAEPIYSRVEIRSPEHHCRSRYIELAVYAEPLVD